VPQAQRQLQSAEETLGSVRLVGSDTPGWLSTKRIPWWCTASIWAQAKSKPQAPRRKLRRGWRRKERRPRFAQITLLPGSNN
jgi:hypothetical protein